MDIKPYLFFNGSARDAATLYAKVFGVDVPEIMTMQGAPAGMDIPEERRDWVMHCEMKIGNAGIYLSDDFIANSPAMEAPPVWHCLSRPFDANLR